MQSFENRYCVIVQKFIFQAFVRYPISRYIIFHICQTINEQESGPRDNLIGPLFRCNKQAN